LSPEELYLRAVIQRHRLPAGDPTAERVRRRLTPLLRAWAGDRLESVAVSGSQAKGTALRDGDVDLFLSLSPATPGPLAAIHSSLLVYLRDYLPEPRNVSVRITFEGAKVDLVPGRRRGDGGGHTLWQLRRDTWIQTDVGEQIRRIRSSGRREEILALKVWRRRHALRFPSFCLELAVLRALAGWPGRSMAASFLEVLRFLAGGFAGARLLDPGNSNNVVSDALTPEEKLRIAAAGEMSLRAPSWPEIL
jgi:hypothetical protein